MKHLEACRYLIIDRRITSMKLCMNRPAPQIQLDVTELPQYDIRTGQIIGKAAGCDKLGRLGRRTFSDKILHSLLVKVCNEDDIPMIGSRVSWLNFPSRSVSVLELERHHAPLFCREGTL